MEIEDQLKNIWTKYHETQNLNQLQQFLYKKIDEMTWEDWSYVYINFQLTETITRQFRNYLDISFIYEMALQDWVDKDLNLMREFKEELKRYWKER